MNMPPILRWDGHEQTPAPCEVLSVTWTGISDDHVSVCWLWLVLLSSAPGVVERVLDGAGEVENHHHSFVGTALNSSHASSCVILPTALRRCPLCAHAMGEDTDAEEGCVELTAGE